VTVHTGFPHYPSGRIAPPYRNRPLRRERASDGVRIVRSAVLAAPNRGFARRLADHLAFAGSALAAAPASGPADVVVAETPPLFLAAAAAGYAAVKRAPLVVHVADLWPASAVALGALSDRRAIALAERLERFAYRHAEALAAPTAGIVAALSGRHDRVAHLPPAVDGRRFAHLPSPPDGRLEVLYAGTVGMAQGVDALLEAARRAGPDAVGVTIAGAGAQLDAVARDAPPNVRLLGAVPAAHVPALYGAAHAGAVLLRDIRLFEGALPTKLLECMAAGRPVVLAARGEAAELVARTRAGIVVAPEDPEAIARAFRDLAADRARGAALGENGRRAAIAEFDRERSTARWAALLEEVTSRAGGPAGRASRTRPGSRTR
jgi:colanic acid biosynthesis glycosyl transferase WcaI